MSYISFFIIIIIDASKDLIVIRKRRVCEEVFIVVKDLFENWFQRRNKHS